MAAWWKECTQHIIVIKLCSRHVDLHHAVWLQVHGEQDRLVPIGNSCRLSAVLGGAPVVKIAGCGHNPMEELPQCFTSEVCRFVDATVRPHIASSSRMHT